MSSDSRVALQPAYVLHRRPYRDTSALLEVLTSEYGRMALVGRGVQRSPRRGSPLLQPFRPLLLSWVGTGDLVTMTGAEPDGRAPGVSGEAVLSGLYLNELLLRLLPRHDAQPELFLAYAATLQKLADADGTAAQEQALRLFELRLLDALGYGLALDTEAETGRPIEAAASYCYEIERGPILAEGSGDGPRVHGRTLLALRQGTFADRDSLREAKQLMRAALGAQLGGRPLHSRELMRARQTASEATAG